MFGDSRNDRHLKTTPPNGSHVNEGKRVVNTLDIRCIGRKQETKGVGEAGLLLDKNFKFKINFLQVPEERICATVRYGGPVRVGDFFPRVNLFLRAGFITIFCFTVSQK